MMEWIAALALPAVLAALGFVVAARRRNRRPSDRDVLERLRQGGSDLSQPHLVEFFLHFPTRDVALRVADVAAAEGFEASVGPGAGSKYQIVLATREMVPALSELAGMGERFARLAAAEGGTYEGWAATAFARPLS